MEPKKKGAKTTKEGEDGSLRSSSSSSASAESASSEFSLDECGNLARENKGFDKGKLQPETSSSLESPLAQVMEMPSESSGYRFPSHVFAPSTPNGGDWSSASNESLFSIHNGNMSFTRDAYLMKSGELPPLSPTYLQKSGEMTIIPPDLKKSGEEIIAAHFNTPSPSQSVPSESAVDLGNGTKKDEMPFINSTISHNSNNSGQSFAFPVLTNDDRQKSVNSGASRAERQKDVSEASVNEENEKTQKENTDETTAHTSSSSSSWFSSLSCCSCWTSKQS